MITNVSLAHPNDAIHHHSPLVEELEGPVVDGVVGGAEEDLRGGLDGAQSQRHDVEVLVVVLRGRVTQKANCEKMQRAMSAEA